MSTRKKLSWALPVALIMAVFAAAALFPVYATTNTPSADAVDANVGGLPLCLTYTGTSATSTADDLVLSLPGGFVPRFVEFVPDLDSDSNRVLWYYGQASGTAFSHTNGTVATGMTAGLTFHANGTAGVNVTTATSGQVTISNEAQTASATYFARICR